MVPLRSLVAAASSPSGRRSAVVPADAPSLGSPEARALLASSSAAKELDTTAGRSQLADRLAGDRSPPLSPRTVFSASSIASTAASAGPRAPPAGTVAGLRAALMPLAVRLRARLDTRDRVFHLRTYRNSFVGSQCVDLLVRWGLVPSRVMAVALGRQLLAARFIHHVVSPLPASAPRFSAAPPAPPLRSRCGHVVTGVAAASRRKSALLSAAAIPCESTSAVSQAPSFVCFCEPGSWLSRSPFCPPAV